MAGSIKDLKSVPSKTASDVKGGQKKAAPRKRR
jgi:hypothetical protein